MNLEIAKFQLLNKLKDNSAKRRKLATSGKLEPSRLAHYKTSKLLYSEPIPWTGKEYVCDILLDVSGSMRHQDRMRKAINSTKALIELFHWVVDFRITWFALSSFQLSKNRILSLPSELSSEDICFEELNRKVGRVRLSYWEDLIPVEWGEYDNFWGTWWSGTLEKSRRSFIEDKREKMIILITDGVDNQDDLWGRYSKWVEKEYNITHIEWVPVSEANPLLWREIVGRVKEDGILFMPIGLNISLDHIDENHINLTDTSKIYEEVINFISTNI